MASSLAAPAKVSFAEIPLTKLFARGSTASLDGFMEKLAMLWPLPGLAAQRRREDVLGGCRPCFGESKDGITDGLDLPDLFSPSPF